MHAWVERYEANREDGLLEILTVIVRFCGCDGPLSGLDIHTYGTLFSSFCISPHRPQPQLHTLYRYVYMLVISVNVILLSSLIPNNILITTMIMWKGTVTKDMLQDILSSCQLLADRLDEV